MDFGHYGGAGAELAAGVVNSLGSTSGNEYLPGPGALRALLNAHGVRPPAHITARDVEEVRALRPRLRAIFEASDAAAAARVVNELLVEADALPQMARGEDARWRLEFAPAGASLARRLLAVSAMGLAVTISQRGMERLGVCAAHGCRDVFVDTSRNRSRRYCNEICSTRTNVAAYRMRHRAARRESS